jgi:hypothetical protein
MGKYAAHTTVPVAQSRMELEQILARYGADKFASGWDRTKASIFFEADGRRVRFELPLPDRNDPAFTQYKQGSTTFQRAEGEAEKRWEQASRQRWRALVLVVKAKLEAVDAGITTFEEEFLAHIVLPTGQTVFEATHAGIEHAYTTGTMPALLPGTA